VLTKKIASSKRWTVGGARANLPELFKAAVREPQHVFRRREAAAVVVSPQEFEELSALKIASSRETLSDAFAQLRELDGGLEMAPRRDRKNGFADADR
jgi:PHD/YefM family antitoxin component YafN of YafNO toxin-antitoxin module